jgi:phosphatidylglycerophosphate synthase
MHNKYYYLVNGITLYRLVMAPILIFFAFDEQLDLFKWLIALSFLTDAFDGYLARRYKAVSVLGAKIDSVADDLTIFAAFIGVVVFRYEFLKQHIILLGLLFFLYLFQLISALVRYRKPSGFHTYTAKIAAVLQGIFLVALFFFPEPFYILFYAALIFTALDLVEEIVLVFLLPQWQADVKGLFWVIRGRHIKRV